jgi:hypothetical protein
MNDFEGISFFQQSRAVRCARNDILIEFDHNPARANLKLLEQPGYAEPLREFFLFSVDANFHKQQKNRIRSNHLTVAREYGFKFAPICSANLWAVGTVTFTLPYAGAIRIRFEGLPGYSSGSQSASGRHP